ncbi:MAG: DUF3352 domain-containing protein [Anaerolineae bacterium]|nr:DUF3352 domain-containing protein [Anaerolineae bacterium]
MRRTVCWLAVLILAGLALGACSLRTGQQETTTLPAFDVLAQRIPAAVDNAFFFDFKPDDPAAQHWAAIRSRLEQNPQMQQGLENLLDRFRVEAYGLEAVIEGPAATALWDGTTVVLLPVLDEAAAWDRMVHNLGDAQAWEQETVEGRLIYHGRFWEAGNQPTHLAWTMDKDLLYLAYRPDSRSVDRLADLLELARGASLAALDSWEVLRQRLPDDPLAVVFVPVAELAGRPTPVPVNPPAAGDQPPSAALERHLEALALAFTPEDAGLRMDIQGVLDPDAGAEPALQALFKLPAVEAAGWDRLPANTALALLSHDAPAILPWFSGIFGLDLGPETPFGAAAGLDLQADLLGEGGPLMGPFALAVTPPLPAQPISQGLPALQALLASREVLPAQVERLAAALEGRGAVLDTADLTGMELRTQVGTQLSGYALSFGLDGGTLYMGSNPQIIEQAVVAGSEGSGLLSTAAFQAVLPQLPEGSFLLGYVSSQPLIELIQFNTDGEQDGPSAVVQFLDAFDAMGIGLRLESEPAGGAGPGRVEGVAYFLMEE